MLCMLLSIGGVTVFAGTPVFDVTDHWKKNVVIFYNVDDIFNAATICYCADGSEKWQNADMTYGGKNEYHQDSWYFTMPEGKYRYYITDGTHRTQEQYFTNEVLLYLMNETDKNGYYELLLDWISSDTEIFDVTDHWKKNVVIFYNVDDIFNAATICYCADGSEKWQNADMTYGGKNEYHQDSWYFTMPEGKYRYYITDGTHRTQEQYFTNEVLLYLMNETDKNGYYELLLDWISGLKGDADNDGEVTILDATYIQRHLADIVLSSPIVKEAADVDGDGDVTIVDATRIQRALVGICNLDGTPC